MYLDIILSLVRTAHIGYLRDIRRLTVALSRARLGLYILGRRTVFESCPELKPAFDRLFAHSDVLQLVTGETHPTDRAADAELKPERVAAMTGVEHLGQYVFEMTQAKIKALKGGAPPEPDDALDGIIKEEYEDDAVEEEDFDAGVEEADDEFGDDRVMDAEGPDGNPSERDEA